MDPLISTSGTWWLVATAGMTRVEANVLMDGLFLLFQPRWAITLEHKDIASTLTPNHMQG